MDKINILFVCLGNICRSPSAEGVLKYLIQKEGLEDKIFVDSAGTIGYHIGESADPRMRMHASRRNYKLDSVARKFNPHKDFEKFDYIVAMDNENYETLLGMAHTHQYRVKIHKMAEYAVDIPIEEIPDPYYGGPDKFEYVLDIIEDTCKGLLDRLKDELKQ